MIFNPDLSMHVYLHHIFSKYDIFVMHRRNRPKIDRASMTICVFWKRNKWHEFYLPLLFKGKSQ